MAGPRAAEPLGTYYARYATAEIPRLWDTAELIDLVGLTAQAHKRIGNLSGGQRRRLDVAIGIVGRPELLFLDEPTAGFDPMARREFHELVHRLTDQEQATVLLTTHDLAEAEKLADRVLILAGGGSSPTVAGRARAADVGAGRGQVEVDGQRYVHPTRRRRRSPSCSPSTARRSKTWSTAGEPGGHVHGAGQGTRRNWLRTAAWGGARRH